jgi:hypothetical protein
MPPGDETLARLVRAKYPGAYDDMTDVQLEDAVLAKYPEYRDVPRTQPTAADQLRARFNRPASQSAQQFPSGTRITPAAQGRPIRVDVPGLGSVEFPAGTTEQQMTLAIRQELGRQQRPQASSADLARQFGGVPIGGEVPESMLVPIGGEVPESMLGDRPLTFERVGDVPQRAGAPTHPMAEFGYGLSKGAARTGIGAAQLVNRGLSSIGLTDRIAPEVFDRARADRRPRRARGNGSAWARNKSRSF